MHTTEEIVTLAERLASDRFEGFTLLGRGSTRDAWLGPDGLVYKVPNCADGVDANLCEAYNYHSTSCPPGWRLAKSMLVEFDTLPPVVVMEHVTGVHDWAGTGLEDFESASRLLDVDVENFLVDSLGERVVFDYAQ